jgi:hypothetical protein
MRWRGSGGEVSGKQTLSIDTSEWRALFIENIQRLANFVGQNQAITPEGLQALHTHLARSRMIAAAWCAAGRPPATVEAAQPATPSSPLRVEAMGVPAPVISAANGDAPKRRGGWPKGKPRARQKPMQVQ